MRAPLSLCLAFLTVVAAPAFGQGQALLPEEPGPRCDLLAADPYDHARPEGLAGVPAEAMQAEAAFDACTEAVEAHPDEPRYRHNLGRSLLTNLLFEEARATFKALAEKGYVASMLRYSATLDHGWGGEKDEEAAFRWMKRAADAGHPIAMIYTGQSYEHGWGVEPDIDRAIDYFQRLAEAGYAEGLYFLGSILATDPLDDAEFAYGMELLARAADSGIAEADGMIGIILLDDSRESYDLEAGLAALERAARAGNLLSSMELAAMYAKGDRVERDMEEATYWVCLAGRKGVDFALNVHKLEVVCDAP